MRLEFEVPKHLEGYLGGMSQEALNKFLVMMVELGINHKLLTYPKVHIERQVDDIENALVKLLKDNDSFQYKVMSQLEALTTQVSSMRQQTYMAPVERINRMSLEDEETAEQNKEDYNDDDDLSSLEKLGEGSSDKTPDDLFKEDMLK